MSGIPSCPECIHSGDSLDRAYRTEDKQAEHATNDVCRPKCLGGFPHGGEKDDG